MLGQAAQKVIERLKASGYEAYGVGGCVRDLLMGVVPHDYDVCTSAQPQETMACFHGQRLIETGLKHGTVTVMVEGEPIEVTTYRTDGEYTDGRHPDQVAFVKNLKEDLKRRDFTINAMVMDEKGHVVDYFDGQRDIENKLIRCVGDADTRFLEDALRILRALRFASTLGFKIEKETAASIHKNKQRLNLIAKERIAVELNKLLMGDGVLPILLSYHDVLSQVMPQLGSMAGFLQHNPYHCYDVWAHTAYAVAASKKELRIRWAMLLHDSGKPRCFHRDEKGIGHFYGHGKLSAVIAREVLMDLRMDNKTTDSVCELVYYHDRRLHSKKSIKRLLRHVGTELFDLLLDVQLADDAAKTPDKAALGEKENRALRAAYEDILAQGECFSLRELAVSGQDLVALGYQGKAVGEGLNRLLDLVIDGRVPNKKEALIEQIK